VDPGDATLSFGRVDPLVRDITAPAQHDQILKIAPLGLGRRQDVVADGGEAAVEPELLAQLEVEAARPLAELDRGLGPALLAYDPRRARGRAEAGPVPLADGDPPEALARQVVGRPQ